MPEYHNKKHEQFLVSNKQAAEVAERGTKSGETGDEYVRITVLLATVLLITAIGQRFRFKSVRVVFMILASLLLCLPLWQLLVLPRIRILRSTAILAVGPAGILPADENSQPSETSGVSHRQDACAPFIHVLRPKSYD